MKRFEMSDQSTVYRYSIIDNVENGVLKVNECVVLLNKLNDENEQLRQQLQDWDDMVELATKTSLRNVELDEQNGQLRKELNDCEKFRHTVFKRIGELER